MISYKYECEYCGQKFKQEGRFLKHYCKERKKVEESKSAIGKSAYLIYSQWIKTKGGVANQKSFLGSRYFNTFIRVAKYLKEIDIADVDTFVRFVTEKRYMPSVWTSNDVYIPYIQYMDASVPPLKHATISSKTIMAVADEKEIPTSEFFEHVTGSEVIHLLQTRKLSPWLLYFSNKFKTFYNDKLNGDEKIIINTFLNGELWKERFEKHKRVIPKIKHFVEGLDL